MITPRLQRLLAEVISGLSVPSSIGSILGTARQPYFDLRDYFNLFGYPSVEDVEKAIARKLEEDEKNYSSPVVKERGESR